MSLRHLPNIISILRILLVIPVVWLLLDREYAWALLLFAIAGISDALDGFLAKHFGWFSRLGSIIDPLADKLLLVSCFLTLGWLEVMPWWLVVAVLVRDLVIVIGATAFHLLIGRYDMAPSFLSKINTALQIILVLVVVVYQAGYAFTPGQVDVAMVVVVTTTILSGVHYVVIWGRRALDAAHGGRVS